jgi:cytochrome c oxidase subunit II
MISLLPHILASDKTFWLPKGASNLAPDVDWAWNIILYVTGLFFCIVVGAMTFFVIKYRRRTANDATSEITHNTPLEIAWTFIPLVLVIMFFWVGFKGFLLYDTPRSNCVVVDVEAKKWKFTFTYPNGAQDGDLYVLKDQPVRLNMHSVDVLHGLYLPTFRTQRNLIPYRLTTIWFVPTEISPEPVMGKDKDGKPVEIDPGGWPIFCTQYCGDGHSRMFAHVHVLDQVDYDEKMKELSNPFKKKLASGKSVWVPYKDLGKTLYSQIGCSTCHSIDENKTVGTGPPWYGLYKSNVEFHASNVPGYTLSASDSDEKWLAYLNESILDPDAKLVRYNGTNFHGMTNFNSQLSGNETNDEKRRALIEFIKSIGTLPYKPAVPYDPDTYDADKHPEHHPESVAGLKAREAAASQTQPGGQ